MLDTIEEFKTILENKGIKVYKATPKQTDIILSSYNDFSNLLTEFKVTHLFMNVKFFDESEFEDYFITDDLIENKYISNGILELIKDAVDKFNQTVSEKMNSFMGKEMNKVLFFAFKGFIYSYYEYNPQIIYPDDDPEEILDELINKYRNLQKELDRDDFEKKQEIKKEFFKKLEDEVSRSDIFKTLTNATGRKDYVFGLALEHNPDFYLEYSVMMKDLSKITERVWKKYKFSLIK